MSIDETDRRILTATQGGLPLAPRPFAVVGSWIGLTEAEVIARVAALQEKGIIRRILDGQADDDAETSAQFFAAFDGEDFAEGVSAFLEKRKANFR